jgi:hypothetical protein
MLHHWIFALFVLTVALLAEFVIRLPSLWNAIRVKHARDAVPAKWECLRRLPADTTIGLHLRLNPISVRMPHCTKSTIQSIQNMPCPRPLFPRMYLCPYSFLDITYTYPRCRSLSFSRHMQTRSSFSIHFRISRRALFCHFNDARRRLADINNELLSASYQIYLPTGTNDAFTLAMYYP